MDTSLVNNKYRITRRIGGGSFGEIYLGVGPSGEKVEKHHPKIIYPKFQISTNI